MAWELTVKDSWNQPPSPRVRTVEETSEQQHSLRVALEDIHGVDGRVPEIPETESRVAGGGHHKPLGRVCAAVRELLVMAYKDDRILDHPPEGVAKGNFTIKADRRDVTAAMEVVGKGFLHTCNQGSRKGE